MSYRLKWCCMVRWCCPPSSSHPRLQIAFFKNILVVNSPGVLFKTDFMVLFMVYHISYINIDFFMDVAMWQYSQNGVSVVLCIFFFLLVFFSNPFLFRFVGWSLILPRVRRSRRISMGFQNIWYSHPRKYGQGSRSWYVLYIIVRFLNFDHLHSLWVEACGCSVLYPRERISFLHLNFVSYWP